jgi:predicted peptidase
MLPKLWIYFIFFTLLFVTVPAEAAQESPAMLLKITELKNGLKLRYTLSLPRDFSPTASYPLVIALHYGGKVTPFYSKEFVTALVEPALKDLDAIIAAPDCPAAGWTNTLSESAILELMLILLEEYNIDSDRLVILGYSLGGSGTWYMAARHPDLFSAAIPISAPAESANTAIVKQVPLYIIHGEKDELFSLQEVKSLYQEQKSGGAEIKLVIVPGAGHYQLARFIDPLKAAIPWIKKIWEYR